MLRNGFKKVFYIFTAISLLLGYTNQAWSQQEQLLDQIVAIVAEDVVLLSELKRETQIIKKRLKDNDIKAPSDAILNKQILENLIVRQLQLQEAKRRGIKIDDTTVNQSLRRMANQNRVNLEQFRQKLVREGVDYIEFREDLRKEITLNRLTQSAVNSRVVITEQEVDDYIANLQGKEDNSEYLISQIEVALPEAADAAIISEAETKANAIHKELLDGANFAELAIGKSDGRFALEGGDLGWRKLNQLPNLFAKALRSLTVGKFSTPIRTSRGFHILMLRETKGIQKHMIKQAEVRHILVSTNTIMNDDKARQKLSDIRQQIVDGADFSELAKEHSEDAVSAAKGGELGWTESRIYVPQFKSVIENLPLKKMSEPFKTQYGWHIVEVTGRRNYDNTVEYQRAQARQNIFKRKASVEEELWVRRLRDQAYVEYRIKN